MSFPFDRATGKHCPACGNSYLIEETQVEDFNDPSDPHGHGQREYQIIYCPDCGEVIESEREEDYDE